MSLRGTLDTLSVSDLLTVLAASKRSGELMVRGPGLEGRLWLAHGGLVKADVADGTDLVDAVLALLQLDTGEFSFEAESSPVSASEVTDVAGVLEEAESRLSEWLAAQTAVPTLGARFTLGSEPMGTNVTLTAEEWRVLAALGSGADVRAVMGSLGLKEVEARRTVKALLDAGLLVPAGDRASTGPAAAPVPPPPRPRPAEARTQPEPAPAAGGPAAPGGEGAGGGAGAPSQPRSEEVPDPVDDRPRGEDEPVDRSLLFRYLSGENF